MALLLDIIIIFIFAVSVFTCTKKGFILSIMKIAAVVVALICAIVFYPKLSAVIDENYMNGFMTKKVGTAINSMTSGVDSMDISDLFKEKPKAFTDMLSRFDIDFDTVNDFYENSVVARGAEERTEKVSSFIADRLSEKISDIVAFAAIFIGVAIVMTVLLLLINLIFKLPALNALNKTLGFVLGIILGALYAFGASVILSNIVPHLAAIFDGKVPENVIESTVIVKFLGSINIFNLFH